VGYHTKEYTGRCGENWPHTFSTPWSFDGVTITSRFVSYLKTME